MVGLCLIPLKKTYASLSIPVPKYCISLRWPKSNFIYQYVYDSNKQNCCLWSWLDIFSVLILRSNICAPIFTKPFLSPHIHSPYVKCFVSKRFKLKCHMVNKCFLSKPGNGYFTLTAICIAYLHSSCFQLTGISRARNNGRISVALSRFIIIITTYATEVY